MSSPVSPAAPARSLNPARWSFGVQILLGLAVGVAAGFLARATGAAWLTTTLTQIGSIFVQLLKLAVPPLVFTAVLVSVAGLRHVTNAARLAGRTLLWFLGTSLIAVAVGITLGLVTNPGRGVDLSLTGVKAPEHKSGWTDFLTGIIPTNVVGAFTNGNVLQLVFLGLVFGIAALKLGDAAKPVLDLADSVLHLVQKALWWVIRLAPIGTAGLIGKAVASYGWNLLQPLATFAAAIYIGCFLVLAVVYPVLLRAVAGVNPLRFYAKAWPALELAFVSRSSIGTMPLTQRITIERLGVPREYGSFAVPFGATTKMDGCAAVYPAVAAIFVAQISGIDLGIRDYLLIAFVSVVGSAATAGLTGAIVMLTLTLSTLGLPLAAAGLLLAIDPILDMIRTATNVAGQMVVPVLVAKREGILDLEIFDGPAAPLTAAEPEPKPEPVAA
ncbi:dicarboxylate/amino acid:cation symporter [Nocardia sp. NPDC051832]|uniref:dicarboxylate/amino acid:cation symporter n=1 Tax=Nocardia sp. NPDC051832 TaxID=3155673 RepID=UPI0034256BAC